MDSGVGRDREVFKKKTKFKGAAEKLVANMFGFSDIVVLFNWFSLSNSKVGARY